MKKYISLLLVLFMIVFMVPTINAIETAPRFVVSSVSGECGDIVDVKVNIENNPGITALQLKINYSSTDLELLSIEDSKLFGDAITHGQIANVPFIISWYSQSSNDKTENGTFVTLKFKILEDASASEVSITYDEDNVFNSSFDNVYFDVVKGKVDITKVLLGDVNKDGVISKSDLSTWMQIYSNQKLIKPNEYQLAVGDLNENGIYDLSDKMLLIKLLV